MDRYVSMIQRRFISSHSLMRTFIFSLLVLTGMSVSAIAGTTGKLSGTVRDADTGEPLIGANIILDGTMIGAATDLDGFYTILNIPPGIYSARFNYVGYQTVLVKDIQINIDFTRNLDQNLSYVVLESNEVVEVVASRMSMIQKDLTNSQVAVSSETIDGLPVDNLDQVIQLQAGITADSEGSIHIRGGRSNEVAIQVNGISMANPFDNSQSVSIATNAVQEVSVSAGTFSAEYGNALSGVINYVTKEGGNHLSGTLKVRSGDNWSSRSDVFYGIDNFNFLNNNRIEGTIGGPIPGLGNKAKFFISAVSQNNEGFLYGIDLYKPEDILYIDGDSLIIDPYGDGKPSGSGQMAAMNVVKSYNLTSKFSYKISNALKLSYDLVLDYSNHPGSGQFRNFRFNPDGRLFVTSQNQSHSIGLTHVLSNTTFYNLKFAVNLTHAQNWVYDDPFDTRYIASYEGSVSNNLFPNTDYLAGGHNLDRDEDQTKTYVAKFDFVNQITKVHELRAGGEFNRHDLIREDYTLLHTDMTGASLPIIPYPELNPSYTEYQYYQHNPIQSAAYFLDKMELAESFILNIGLRYEYFHSKALYNPDLVGSVDTGVEKNLEESDPKHRLAPRISLSFPITAEGIIRFSYGHFYQTPPLSQIYRNPRFVDRDFISVPSFGNANLEPEGSIQYELGLQQGLTDDIKFDLTAYYKDVSNLVQSRRMVAGEAAASKEFNVITNISYANVKGFTLSVLKRRSPGGLFSGNLDYTYQVAEGAFEDPLDFFLDARSDRQSEQEFIPLSHDRTHTINATLSMYSDDNWSSSAIFSYWTGTPYTPTLPSNLSPIEFRNNSARRPANINFDLRYEKYLHLGSIPLSVFVQVNNVLDLDNERNVHKSTGTSLSSLDEATNPYRFDGLRAQMGDNPDAFFDESFLDTYYQREDWLSPPREIRVGMSVSFEMAGN